MALNQAGNPYKCPCCFPCDEIPLCTSAFPDCPSAYYCGPTRRENDPGWATPTYTPKCRNSWGDTGAGCVYWSPEVGNAECNCTGVWAQYCIDYPSGNKGRAWVVEFFCIDGDTQAVSAATYIAPDWQCACGDIAGQLAGSGPRFQFFITPSGCCCECGGIPTDCCDVDVPTTLTVELSGSGCADFTTTVTWDAGLSRWQGTVTICGLEMSVTVSCETGTGPGFVISVDYISPLGGTLGVTDPIAATCSPFFATQSMIPLFFQDAIETCCGGTSGSGVLTATA